MNINCFDPLSESCQTNAQVMVETELRRLWGVHWDCLRSRFVTMLQPGVALRQGRLPNVPETACLYSTESEQQEADGAGELAEGGDAVGPELGRDSLLVESPMTRVVSREGHGVKSAGDMKVFLVVRQGGRDGDWQREEDNTEKRMGLKNGPDDMGKRTVQPQRRTSGGHPLPVL